MMLDIKEANIDSAGFVPPNPPSLLAHNQHLTYDCHHYA